MGESDEPTRGRLGPNRKAAMAAMLAIVVIWTLQIATWVWRLATEGSWTDIASIQQRLLGTFAASLVLFGVALWFLWREHRAGG